MITEWEIWACGNYLIHRHGETAALEATMRADELLAEGDLKGMRTFQAIARRIDQLMGCPTRTLH